jgi:hypothetical protein
MRHIAEKFVYALSASRLYTLWFRLLMNNMTGAHESRNGCTSATRFQAIFSEWLARDPQEGPRMSHRKIETFNMLVFY